MNPLTIGILLALTCAGPPLYQLVTTGNLGLADAVFRATLVATACVAGTFGLWNLIQAWEQGSLMAKEEQMGDLFDEMAEAVAAGRLTAEDNTDATSVGNSGT